jgi:SHS2 domain-containing protein
MARTTRPRRGHVLLPHTADVGLGAEAADLPDLFEEAAAALAELLAEIAPGVEASTWEAITLEARDLPGLAYTWLNELIALGDIHHGAVVTATVERLDGPADDDTDGAWRLLGRAGIRAYGEPGVRALRQAKSATYHGLLVERRGGGWAMRAYLDI